MTTRAEEIAGEEYPDTTGPDGETIHMEGQRQVFVKAYKHGQQDRWISVKDEEPANGQLVVVWAMEHPDKAQSAPGFHLLSWVRHGALHWPRFATWRSRVTYWMPMPLPPNPEQR